MRGLFLTLFVFPVFVLSPAFAAQDCDKAQNSADVMRCLNTQYEDQQAEMNKKFDLLLQQHADEDDHDVRDIQMQWLSYRDKECGHETMHLETESLKRLELLKCLSRITQERMGAIESSLAKAERREMVGEASTQPRWMNALAEDNPDVFWRYGARIDGDLDCDEAPEYLMTGLRSDPEGHMVEPVLSISESPLTGRPESQVVSLSSQFDSQKCGAVLGMNFKIAAKSEEMCMNRLVLSVPGCEARSLYWTGEVYAFEE